jgi:hypothetical protein
MRTFATQNGLRQGDDFSSLSFNFTYKYAVRRIPANQKGSKLNGTHQLMLCAGKDNVLGENVGRVKKNMKVLLPVTKVTAIQGV